MAKPWTEKEDALLMLNEGIGPDFVARHDLGRPDGAGSARLKKLIASGAAHEFARAMLHLENYRLLSGTVRSRFGKEFASDAADDWAEKAGRW